jgi:hypothetical protein
MANENSIQIKKSFGGYGREAFFFFFANTQQVKQAHCSKASTTLHITVKYQCLNEILG